jgi:hypothetical protein
MKSSWILRPGAAEFPHENALLDRGALWVGTALCALEIAESIVAKSGPAKARAGANAKKASVVPETVEAPRESTAVAPLVETRGEGTATTRLETPDERPAAFVTPVETGTEHAATEHPEAHDERVETFVRAITEVALAHGAAETAAHVESLFKFGTPAPLALSALARAALLDGNILEATDEGFHVTAWFARTSSAWQNMLRGEGASLAECGESTLDGFTADLIACLVAKPSMASTIRRDLRRLLIARGPRGRRHRRRPTIARGRAARSR